MPFGMGPAGWLMYPYIIYPYLNTMWVGYYQSLLRGWFPYYTLWGMGDELSYLKQLKQNLEIELQSINQRIEELEKGRG